VPAAPSAKLIRELVIGGVHCQNPGRVLWTPLLRDGSEVELGGRAGSFLAYCGARMRITRRDGKCLLRLESPYSLGTWWPGYHGKALGFDVASGGEMVFALGRGALEGRPASNVKETQSPLLEVRQALVAERWTAW